MKTSSANPVIPDDVREDILKITVGNKLSSDYNWVTIIFLAFVAGIVAAIVTQLLASILNIDEIFTIASISGSLSAIAMMYSHKKDTESFTNSIAQKLENYLDRVNNPNTPPIEDMMSKWQDDLNR